MSTLLKRFKDRLERYIHLTLILPCAAVKAWRLAKLQARVDIEMAKKQRQYEEEKKKKTEKS